jgi:signal transduction histidine kinase
VWRDLTEVIAARDPAPSWRWRAAWHQPALYAVLTAAAVYLFRFGVGTDTTAPWVLVPLEVAPLPLAIRHPLVGWRVGWFAMAITPLVLTQHAGTFPWNKMQLAVLWLIVCVAGYRHGRRVLWWIWALTLLPYLLRIVSVDSPDRGPDALIALGMTAVVIATDAVSSRRRIAHELVEQAALTEVAQARGAVLEERTRIAREMHDIVAHHMSLIAVRAESTPYRLADLPEPVREEFAALSGAAREAMTDMRRLLGVLRDSRPVDLAPQPRLSDVPALVDSAREAGVEVRLEVAAPLDDLPASIGVCAYRIVQESLSNAGRHAPGSAVTVSVGQRAATLALRVANGPGGVSRAVSGGGHGLAGMRERVALLGGTLSAGPAEGGGFVVSAVLPLREGS